MHSFGCRVEMLASDAEQRSEADVSTAVVPASAQLPAEEGAEKTNPRKGEEVNPVSALR